MLQPFAQDVASVLLQFVHENGIPKGLTALISSAARRIGSSDCVTCWWGQRSFRDLFWALENVEFIRASIVNNMPNGRKNEVQNVLQSILGRVFHHLFAVAFANLPLQHVKAMKVRDLLPTSEAYPCPGDLACHCNASTDLSFWICVDKTVEGGFFIWKR